MLHLQEKDIYKPFERKAIILKWTGAVVCLLAVYVIHKSVLIFAVGAVIFIVGYVYSIRSKGNHVFWSKVRDYPDEAYDWFQDQRSWAVFDQMPDTTQKYFDKKRWMGPFFLTVPKLNNRRVKIFGEVREALESQAEFLKKIQLVEN